MNNMTNKDQSSCVNRFPFPIFHIMYNSQAWAVSLIWDIGPTYEAISHHNQWSQSSQPIAMSKRLDTHNLLACCRREHFISMFFLCLYLYIKKNFNFLRHCALKMPAHFRSAILWLGNRNKRANMTPLSEC